MEILKESVKVTKDRENAGREYKEREMRLRWQRLNIQQQFQQIKPVGATTAISGAATSCHHGNCECLV